MPKIHKNNTMVAKMKKYRPTEETIIKLRKPHKPMSEETLLKRRLQRKPLSQETKNKIRQKAIGRVFSEETRRKMSESRKNRVMSEETKLKLSIANKNKKKNYKISEKQKEHCRLKMGFLVLDITTGIYFYSVREAALAYNINRKSLQSMLNKEYRNKTNLILV
jgi:hypothetical protein